MFKQLANWQRIKEFILELLFPKECLGCGQAQTYLCGQCLAKIELNKKFYCALCKKESNFGLICQSCRQNSPLIAIWVAADYNNEILQNLIHCLKYKYLQEVSEILAKLMLKYLHETEISSHFDLKAENTILVPVPLHQKRLLNRGFNQSDLLGQALSLNLGFKKKNILTRIKNTLTQINLKRNQRQENVKDAFSLEPFADSDKNKKIILVDDVVTTGSTLNECAKILAQNGFKEIYGLVVAQRED